MSFGDVGEVAETEIKGYNSTAHSLGDFKENKLLDRMVHLLNVTWTESSDGVLYFEDVDKLLREYFRNAEVLKFFQYYHADLEITVRLNTNQFYYGSLMVNLYPSNATGSNISELAVLDPTILSASSAESVIKTWKWTWPYPWKKLHGDGDMNINGHPVWLVITILNKLKLAKTGMPDAISVQIWGRFVDTALAYPIEPLEAQSAKTKWPRRRPTDYAMDDPGTSQSKNPIGEVVDAVASVPMNLIDGAASAVTGLVNSGLGDLFGALLDKPDTVDPQTPMILEQSKDMYATDIPDSNVCVSIYKARYLDPASEKMPMSKNWTVSDYARIPGLKGTFVIVDSTPHDLTICQRGLPGDALRTPFDYALCCSSLVRGGCKVMLQFFTSSFISARVVVQIANYLDFPTTFDNDYSYGISKIINVKGDTVDTMYIPWLSDKWWEMEYPLKIRVYVDSHIATTEATEDPTIYCNVWVAAGEDTQFAWPTVPTTLTWPEDVGLEAQASPGLEFLRSFPPVVEQAFADVDQGFCNTEILGPITDLCKRYTLIPDPGLAAPLNYNIFPAEVMDESFPYAAGDEYSWYCAWRRTIFGAWRAAFINRAGGYKIRRYSIPASQQWLKVTNRGSEFQWNGTDYQKPYDDVYRLTIPQISKQPFYCSDDKGFDGESALVPSVEASSFGGSTWLFFVGARDDLNLGYPILPSGVPRIFVPPQQPGKAAPRKQ